MLAGGDAGGGQRPSSTSVFLSLCGGRSSQQLHPRPRSPVVGRLRQHRGLGGWPERWLARVKACERRFLPGGVFVASIVPPPLEFQGKS
jgi:hypothetical protein